jgi:hypothetical protein
MKVSPVGQLYLAIVKGKNKKGLSWVRPFLFAVAIVSWLSFLFAEVTMWSSFTSSLVVFLAVPITGLTWLMLSSVLAVVQIEQFRHALQSLMAADWKCYEFLYIENKIKDSRLLKNAAFIFITGRYCQYLGLSKEAYVLLNHAIALNPHIARVLFSGEQKLSVDDAHILIQEFTAGLRSNFFEKIKFLP